MIIGIISIGTFANYFFGVANQTLLMADQASYIYDTVSIVSTIANTLLTVLLMKLNQSIFIVKLGSSIVYFLSPLFLNFYVRKKYDLTSNCEADNSPLKNRSAVMFHSIANIVHQNTDVVLLTLFTDAKIISVYSVYYLVVGKMRTLLNSLTSGFEAAMGNMWAKKEYDSLETAFSGVEYICYSFSFVIFSCVAILLVPFIKLYTSGVADVQYVRIDFAALVIVAEMIFCIRQPYLCLVQAAGFYNETKKGAIFEAATNVISSLILVLILGLNGVIIGTILANLIRTTQYAWYVKRKILKHGTTSIIKRLLWLVIAFLITVTVVTVIVSYVIIDGWIGWVIKGVIAFVLVALIQYISSVLLFKKDFQYCISRLKSILVKKRH